MPVPDLYFHGTASLSAMTAWMNGEPVRARRFKGRRVIPGGLNDHVYCTPDLGEACKYAMMNPFHRKDRPQQRLTIGEMYQECDGRGFVAALDFTPDGDVPFTIDEDQLGKIVRGIVYRKEYGGDDYRGFSSMSSTLAAALRDRPDMLEDLLHLAECGLPPKAIADARTEAAIKGPKLAGIGRAMQPLLSQAMRSDLAAAGCNLAVASPLRILGVWELPQRYFIRSVDRISETRWIVHGLGGHLDLTGGRMQGDWQMRRVDHPASAPRSADTAQDAGADLDDHDPVPACR